MTIDTDRTKTPSNQEFFWASRRGMLELDLLLVPYVEANIAKLSPEDRKHLWGLLQEEDTWLFECLVHRSFDKQDRHAPMLERILNYANPT